MSNGYVASVQEPWPDHQAHESKKSKKAWGLQAAKAIWKTSGGEGIRWLFKNRTSYDKILQYAFGKQDKFQYQRVLGINPNTDNPNQLKAVRLEIKNYATKRCMMVVNRLMDRQYDPIADPIDPVSMQEKEQLRKNMVVTARYKEFLTDVSAGINAEVIPEQIRQHFIPDTEEQANMYMEMNYKDMDAMRMEQAIRYHIDRNDIDTEKEDMDFDLFALGFGIMMVSMDGHFNPKPKRLNPFRCIIPYSETGRYKNMPYFGYVEDMTIAEFKAQATDLSATEINDVITRFSNTHDQHRNHYHDNTVNTPDQYSYNEERRIKVLHFRYVTTNEEVWVEKPNKAGQMTFLRSKSRYATEEAQKKFKQRYGDNGKIYRKRPKCVYEGYWVVNSDYLFGYRMMNSQIRPMGNYGESLIGVAAAAPIMYHGHSTSLLEQMVPCLDNLQTYYLKAQQEIATYIPLRMGINLYALRNVSYKIGDRKLSPEEIVEFAIQKGIVLFDEDPDPTRTGKRELPIEVYKAEISQFLPTMLQLIADELNTLDEIIGFNQVSAASTINSEVGKAVAQQMAEQSETALQHVYRADKYIIENVYRMIGILHFQAEKHAPEKFEHVFSDYGRSDRFGEKDYGFTIEARPTKQEWNDFYLSLDRSVEKGNITEADRIAVRRIQNMKQAEAYFRLLVEKNQKQAMEMQERNVQQNAQVQMQSNQQAHQYKMEELQLAGQNDIAVEVEKRKTVLMEAKLKLETIAQADFARLINNREERQAKSAMKQSELEVKKEENAKKINQKGNE
ncbi:MAG: hypothetical protein F6K19_01670 [Cyanothece sp. SIO1E1]|nr:hypothetical protein [Cyanothece sp. SIO1E1]